MCLVLNTQAASERTRQARRAHSETHHHDECRPLSRSNQINEF